MTPLILLVGFLGAGKTTYLRRLLPLLQEKGLQAHVIINDFQNASVDASLLQDISDAVTPISGTCVCCGSRESLVEAFQNFEHRPGRVVIVETNGTTDSEELVEWLSLAPELEKFTAPVQLSVIDGKRWQKRFWHNRLELEQTRTASYVYVSRAEEVGEQRMAQVSASLRHHKIADETREPAQFTETIAQLSAEYAPVGGRSELAKTTYHIHEHHDSCSCTHEHQGHEHHRHDHSEHHFASFQIDLPEIVERKALEAFLNDLPDEVIRAKGLVRLTDSPDKHYIFQKVDRFDAVQLFPLGKNSPQKQPLAIFIGPRIPEEEVRTSADRLLRI